jgi:hypothetical protein
MLSATHQLLTCSLASRFLESASFLDIPGLRCAVRLVPPSSRRCCSEGLAVRRGASREATGREDMHSDVTGASSLDDRCCSTLPYAAASACSLACLSVGRSSAAHSGGLTGSHRKQRGHIHMGQRRTHSGALLALHASSGRRRLEPTTFDHQRSSEPLQPTNLVTLRWACSGSIKEQSRVISCNIQDT